MPNASWFQGTDTKFWQHLDSIDDLKRRNLINVVTPDEAVRLINSAIAEAPLESFGLSIGPQGSR